MTHRPPKPHNKQAGINQTAPIVFLLDVDNTLLGNDRVIDDLLNYDLPALCAASMARHPAATAIPTK